MKNIILISAIVCTIVTSAFAAQGKGYREYGEKIEKSPGADVHLEEMPPGSFDRVIAGEKIQPRSFNN